MTGELIPATALLAANALLLCAAALELLRVRRIVRRLRTAAAETGPAAPPEATERQAARLPEGFEARLLAGLDERIASLERIAAGLAANPPAGAKSAPAAPGFAHAVRMAQGGASVDDLGRICGLNRGAAELLIRLYAGSAAANEEAALSAPAARPRPRAAAPAASPLRA